mmetsp:Transcript_91855/g.148289  ORF Transcript_91855/g.148289 Transcript_91855/m.148289 type:complete len:100 (-) Transcript_91855:17-316(-)
MGESKRERPKHWICEQNLDTNFAQILGSLHSSPQHCQCVVQQEGREKSTCIQTHTTTCSALYCSSNSQLFTHSVCAVCALPTQKIDGKVRGGGEVNKPS